MQSNLMTGAEVASLLHVSRATLAAYVKKGIVPPPIALTKRRHVWRADEVLEAIERRRSEMPQ